MRLDIGSFLDDASLRLTRSATWSGYSERRTPIRRAATACPAMKTPKINAPTAIHIIVSVPDQCCPTPSRHRNVCYSVSVDCMVGPFRTRGRREQDRVDRVVSRPSAVGRDGSVSLVGFVGLVGEALAPAFEFVEVAAAWRDDE